MTDQPDPLDALRAPVPVGASVRATGRPAIDARSIVPRPATRTGPTWAAPPAPPDPLGVLGRPGPVGGDVDDEVFAPVAPVVGRSRWIVGAVAVAALVLVLVGAAVFAGTRPDDTVGSGIVASEPTLPATVTTVPSAPPGRVMVTDLSWGVGVGVCPGESEPCYMATTELTDFTPQTSVTVTCVIDGADTPPSGRADVDASGAATVAVSCPESPRARSFTILVDGEPTVTVDLPTTIVPAPVPAVTLSVGRSAVGLAGCSVPACRFADVGLAGFPPGATVVVDCHGGVQGAFGASEVTIGPDGTAVDDACYFGYAGETFWVEADGVASATIIWPAS